MMNEGSFTSIYLMLKSIITLHKILNPLLFTPDDYIEKRFSTEEHEILNTINQKYEDLLYFIQKGTSLRILDIPLQLRNVFEVLSPDEINVLNTCQHPIYEDLHQMYFGALTVR